MSMGNLQAFSKIKLRFKRMDESFLLMMYKYWDVVTANIFMPKYDYIYTSMFYSFLLFHSTNIDIENA